VRERAADPQAKALAAAEKRLLFRVKALNGVVGRLDRAIDAAANGCCCGGAPDCRPCWYDARKEAIWAIHVEGRRAKALAAEVEQLEDLHAVGKSCKSLSGEAAGADATGKALAEAREQLAAAEKAHDTAWMALCGPDGIDPTAPICSETRCFAAAAV
jgi:hypothetical protein